MDMKTDFRTNQVYLETAYVCGCVVRICPPPPNCPNHIGKKIARISEERRESEGKELKQGTQEAPTHHEVSDENNALAQEEKDRQMKEEVPGPRPDQLGDVQEEPLVYRGDPQFLGDKADKEPEVQPLGIGVTDQMKMDDKVN